MTNPEIAIIGAGMAGFGANYQLSQQKLRPVIYDELTTVFSLRLLRHCSAKSWECRTDERARLGS
jgi:predicted NAD/FAD-dependent oxidoreductase